MKVYIVTAGEYSDYHIDRVFTDQAAAEAYAALRRQSPISMGARVEEYDTDNRVPAQRTVYQCWQRLTGPNSIMSVCERSWAALEDEWEYGQDRPRIDVSPPTAEADVARPAFWRQKYQQVAVTATCLDRDLALKALHDRMAAIRAKAAGL